MKPQTPMYLLTIALTCLFIQANAQTSDTTKIRKVHAKSIFAQATQTENSRTISNNSRIKTDLLDVNKAENASKKESLKAYQGDGSTTPEQHQAQINELRAVKDKSARRLIIPNTSTTSK